MDKNKMNKYGYYEVYIPIRKNKEQQPINLIIDIYGGELLENFGNENVIDSVKNYGEMEMTRHYEQTIGKHLSQLVEQGLVGDAYCEEYNIKNVKDLERALENNEFTVFEYF